MRRPEGIKMVESELAACGQIIVGPLRHRVDFGLYFSEMKSLWILRSDMLNLYFNKAILAS